MYPWSLSRFLMLACCLGPAVFTGCAKGPAWRLGVLSPWARQTWAEEEKEYGATLYKKLDDVETLTAQAASMDDAERGRWSQQFAQLAVSDPSPLLRARVIGALPSFPSPAADSALHAALDDKDVDVRCAACEAWGRRGGAEALRLLTAKVDENEQIDVRLAAIRALGDLGEQPTSAGAVRALGVALNDKNPAIQYRAIDSLRDVSGRDYGTDLVAWRDFVDGKEPPEPTPTIADRVRNIFY